MEGVPVVLVTCNSLSESKVCEVGNFPWAAITLEACVFTIAVEVKVLSPPLLFPADEVLAVAV
jgi:hypothetical protein